VAFLLLLVILAGLALRITSPEDRERYLGIAIGYIRTLKLAAAESEPEREFRELLRTRTRHVFVTPALIAISAIVVFGMRFGTGAIDAPETLVAWGASLGPRTTNDEWWRLVTSTFVPTGSLQLLVDAAVLIQTGAVLERLAGRLTFAGVYVSAGAFVGLVYLSSVPLAVTSGASGAIFGLYGLLLASAFWQLFPVRGDDPPISETDPPVFEDVPPLAEDHPPVEDVEAVAAVERAEPAVTMPLRTIKRLGAGALAFLVIGALSGFVHTADWAGLLVGAMYGLVVGRRISREEPKTSYVAAAIIAAASIAVACALPLRNIANIKPAILNVLDTEARTADAYKVASDAFKRGRMTADALAQVAERTIVPELQEADARLSALRNVPPEQQSLVADAREYLRLREKSWQARVDAIRKTNPDRRGATPAEDTHSRLQAEARFRSNQTALGNAEGAERTALEAFQRIKGAAPL
jgi:membrane associated rhomboid family serine protease